MDIQFIDQIHEVSVGTNPKEDVRYTVGTTYAGGRLTITEIVYDQNSFFSHGERRVLIYARRKEDPTTDFLWKVLEGQPVVITKKI